MISPIAFTLTLTLIVVLVKLTSFLAPFNLYFSFSTLFVGSGEFFPGRALAIKLVIPFVVGMIVFYVPHRIASAFNRESVIKRRAEAFCNDYAISSAQAAAFFGALLLAWPMIVHWDILAAFQIREYRLVFLVVYFLYFFAYGLLAGAGVRVASSLTAWRSGEKEVKWVSTFRDGLWGALAGGLATAVLGIIIPD
jgi:hypothetical protein